MNELTKNNSELITELNSENFTRLKLIIEAMLMAADSPLSVKNIIEILENHNSDLNTKARNKISYNKKYINLALDELKLDFENRAIELKCLGEYYRIQTKPEFADFVQALWQEKPIKYSKATLETLAIIAYRQPITRSEIENIRGVAVGSQIIRNLADRDWIKIVGYKEVPGRPAIYSTTQTFLQDLNLGKLEDLPALVDIKEIKESLSLNLNLKLNEPEETAEEL